MKSKVDGVTASKTNWVNIRYMPPKNPDHNDLLRVRLGTAEQCACGEEYEPAQNV